MRNSRQLHTDIMVDLSNDKRIDLSYIRVIVEDGIVTLKGNVDSYAKKVTVEDHVKKYREVKMIVNEINVSLRNGSKKSDQEIAKAVIAAFRWHKSIPVDKMNVVVKNGWLTLYGQCENWLQKEAVEGVADGVEGVRGIHNELTIKRASPLLISLEKARQRCYDMATSIMGYQSAYSSLQRQ